MMKRNNAPQTVSGQGVIKVVGAKVNELTILTAMNLNPFELTDFVLPWLC